VKLLLAWCRLCLPRRQQAGWGGPVVAAAAAGSWRRWQGGCGVREGSAHPLQSRDKKNRQKIDVGLKFNFLEVIYWKLLKMSFFFLPILF